MKNFSHRGISLINYEGDNLRLVKSPGTKNFFDVYDQWDKKCYTLSPSALGNWLEGDFAIIDSQEKSWFFPDEKSRAKMEDILEYITS
jgi:hypothetical protein